MEREAAGGAPAPASLEREARTVAPSASDCEQTALSPAALRQRRSRERRRIAREVEFVRADWALFLHPDRLPQKAGCPRDRLRAMILKELVDNALDAGAEVDLQPLDESTWRVTDDGPGLDRGQVVRLFAVNRPMVSTKLLRRPTRGAIGNGLRVVTGGVVASGGTLAVESRGARYVLDVDRGTGETVVVEEGRSDVVAGTRVTVAFGPALPGGPGDGLPALLAIRCAGPAAKAMRSHPSWYDAGSFGELVHAAEPGTTVADIARLMGVRADDDRPAAEAELAALQTLAGPPPALLPLGADRFPGSYAKERRTDGIPVLVEAWATAMRCPPSRGGGMVTLLVNRSPVVARVRITPDKSKQLAIWGCNLAYTIDRVSPGALYDIHLAVTSPVIPVTTEGKEPDLAPLWEVIEPALAKAMRRAFRQAGAGKRKGDIKAAAHAVMEDAYRKAAGSIEWANARQVWYVARQLVQASLGPEDKLEDDYFTQHLLPDFIAGHPELTADWDVHYDARGHLLEPHTGLSVPCGTMQVRDYLLPARQQPADLVEIDAALYPTRGPENRYSTLLYIEKEGFEGLLRKARIAERFDCAILSTKGMPVTSARMLVDAYARQGVRVLVVHDLDRSGAAIAHTLGHDTRRYRFSADPDVIDLGLSLAEAREMGLQDEAAQGQGPGEERLREYGLDEEEIDFLIRQGRRVELNAMTSDELVAWLEGKLREHGAGKVVPEAGVLDRHARRLLARRRVADAVRPLIEAAEAEAAEASLPDDLAERVRERQEDDPALPWEDALEAAVTETVSHPPQVGQQADDGDGGSEP